jgi:hypothetical protein
MRAPELGGNNRIFSRHIEARASDRPANIEEGHDMAAGIKKVRNVKKQLVTDLTVTSVSTADRGAGNSCRVMLIKRDPVLLAIDRAFADHWLGIDSAFAESVLDGTGSVGFDRRAAKLRKKLDRRLEAVRRDADLRPADPEDDRPSLSAGADPSDVESCNPD